MSQPMPIAIPMGAAALVLVLPVSAAPGSDPAPGMAGKTEAVQGGVVRSGRPSVQMGVGGANNPPSDPPPPKGAASAGGSKRHQAGTIVTPSARSRNSAAQ